MALEQLRSLTKAGREATVDGDHIVLGSGSDRRYHKDTPTTYLQTGTEADFYTLGEVVFALQHKADTALGAYIREARKAGVRYPPSCRTIPKSVSFAPSATGIIGRRGRFTAVKAVFAGLLGGAVFRGLSYLGASIFTKALKGVATTKLIK